MTCLGCGSTALVKGHLQADDATSSISFQLADTGTMRSLFGVGRRKVRAYGCIRCGNLQFAVEFTDDDRQRYQQFEGTQPDVLTRINAKTDQE